MEPRPPRGSRPSSPAPYEPPRPSPPQQQPPAPQSEAPLPPPSSQPEPPWDQPSTAPYPAATPPPARPTDPPYRPRTDPYASAADFPGAGTYGSAGVPASPAARPPWYDPAGPGTPGMGVQPPASPPPGERAGSAGGGGWFLRALVAALAVGILLIAAAFAYTRARDDDDDPNEAAVEQTAVRATELAELAAVRDTPAGTPLPTATAELTTTPTVAASPTAAGEAAAAGEESEEGGSASAEDDADEADSEPTAPARTRLPISEMIPEENEAPSDFIIDVETDGRFSFNDVAASLGTIDEATVLLEEWEWQEGLFRAFEPPAGAAPGPAETNYFYVSIHRFGTEEGAVEALAYFADIKASAGLEEVEVDPLGDEMRALSNAGSGSATEVDLYIRDGSRVIRIATFSETGDPLPDAISFAEQVLGIA